MQVKMLIPLLLLLTGCAQCTSTWSYEHCAKACGELGVYRYSPNQNAECTCKNAEERR